MFFPTWVLLLFFFFACIRTPKKKRFWQRPPQKITGSHARKKRFPSQKFTNFSDPFSLPVVPHPRLQPRISSEPEVPSTQRRTTAFRSLQKTHKEHTKKTYLPCLKVHTFKTMATVHKTQGAKKKNHRCTPVTTLQELHVPDAALELHATLLMYFPVWSQLHQEWSARQSDTAWPRDLEDHSVDAQWRRTLCRVTRVFNGPLPAEWKRTWNLMGVSVS